MFALSTLFSVREFDSFAVDAILHLIQPRLRQHSIRGAFTGGVKRVLMYDLGLAFCRCELPMILLFAANTPCCEMLPLLGASDMLFLSRVCRLRAGADLLVSVL